MGKNNKDILNIVNLSVGISDRQILHGVNMEIRSSQVTALMGPNGSGKSTLSHALMGQKEYHVTGGRVSWQGKNLLKLTSTERARLGLFLSFQNPISVPGVNMYEFLLMAYQAIHGKKGTQEEFDKRLKDALKMLHLPESFLERSLNEGFSGGEKKKSEMLQLYILRPKLAILDEIDSGLDIDALKLIARAIRAMCSQTGFLIITHYQRLFTYLEPKRVYILIDGVIQQEGNAKLAKQIGRTGYETMK